MFIIITVGLQSLHFHYPLDLMVCRWLLCCFLFLLSVSKEWHHHNPPVFAVTLSWQSDQFILAFQLPKLLQSPSINGQINNDFSQVVILLVISQEPCIHVLIGENNDTL